MLFNITTELTHIFLRKISFFNFKLFLNVIVGNTNWCSTSLTRTCRVFAISAKTVTIHLLNISAIDSYRVVYTEPSVIAGNISISSRSIIFINGGFNCLWWMEVGFFMSCITSMTSLPIKRVKWFSAVFVTCSLISMMSTHICHSKCHFSMIMRTKSLR